MIFIDKNPQQFENENVGWTGGRFIWNEVNSPYFLIWDN
jgi:hypothetical protein